MFNIVLFQCEWLCLAQSEQVYRDYADEYLISYHLALRCTQLWFCGLGLCKCNAVFFVDVKGDPWRGRPVELHYDQFIHTYIHLLCVFRDLRCASRNIVGSFVDSFIFSAVYVFVLWYVVNLRWRRCLFHGFLCLFNGLHWLIVCLCLVCRFGLLVRLIAGNKPYRFARFVHSSWYTSLVLHQNMNIATGWLSHTRGVHCAKISLCALRLELHLGALVHFHNRTLLFKRFY